MEESAAAAESNNSLHIIILPWLAMGHLLPFFQLSKRLALKGLHISFFSTPSNILRLPSIPQTLTPFLNLIPCSLPPIANLPPNIQNTADLPSESARPLLHQAYAAFEHHITAFLSDSSRPKPNWIIYDFAAADWAPSLATRFGLHSAFFCLFNAAALSFLTRDVSCDSPEKLTKAMDDIPFTTAVAFRPFEARQVFPHIPRKAERAESKSGAGLNLIRTYKEFEAKWLELLGDGFVPAGFLFSPPSSAEDEGEGEGEIWGRMSRWLDTFDDSSVVYAAFGSEVKLTGEQIGEIGLGLEKSGLPFVWVLRGGSPPEGFEERTEGRGMVWMGWAPQARLLAHRAVGGFLTHGGWNSVVEGMVVGAVMVVLPMMFEQGLNARHLVESGYGVEVERDGEDGCFCGEEIGRKLRFVMLDVEGEEVRKKARKGKEVFGNEKLQEEYLAELVRKLREEVKLAAEPI